MPTVQPHTFKLTLGQIDKFCRAFEALQRVNFPVPCASLLAIGWNLAQLDGHNAYIRQRRAELRLTYTTPESFADAELALFQSTRSVTLKFFRVQPVTSDHVPEMWPFEVAQAIAALQPLLLDFEPNTDDEREEP